MKPNTPRPPHASARPALAPIAAAPVVTNAQTLPFPDLRANRIEKTGANSLGLSQTEAERVLEWEQAFSATPRQREKTELSPVENKRFERLVKPAKTKIPCAPCHWGLLVMALVLAAISVPLVYSASTAIALDQHNGDPNFFLSRQIIYSLMGLSAMIVVSRLAPHRLRSLSWALYFLAVGGLLATKFTPLGFSMGNVERWVKIGPLTFQFSELAKIALIGVMADFWSLRAKKSQRSMSPWLWVVGLGGVPFVLTLVQPHLSAALVLGVLPLAIAWCAGVPFKHFQRILLPILVLGAVTVGMCKTHSVPFLAPYQQDRILAQFGGKSDERGGNYQALQGQRAISRGGLTGSGVGASIYKNGHLPAPHTDFIFAVIAEEIGAWGAIGVLAIYGAIVLFCFQTGHNALRGEQTTQKRFEMLLCAGVGTLWAVQVVSNVLVVSGLVPVTGIPLPVLTYGGSGLWCALMGIGMVLSVSRAQCEDKE